ncbi:hypothetical protein ISN45_At05g042510, partial [Arabidopsis thaliana x Arabidopsis arenosa]
YNTRESSGFAGKAEDYRRANEKAGGRDQVSLYDDKLVQDVAIIQSGGVVVPEYSPRSATPIVAKKGTRWSALVHKSYDESLI